MKFDILTIFPGFFTGFLENGILRRALAEGRIEIAVHDLRAFTHDRHRTVDDRPFGGGEGMVLKPQPIAEALASIGIQPKISRDADTHPSETPQVLDSKPASYQGLTLVAPKNSQNQADASTPTEPSEKSPSIPGAQAPSAPRHVVVLLSAQGRTLTQPIARQLASLDRVVLICGRYEGVDERINQLYCDMELSIGDYVLSGGELAAAVVIDAAMRLIPGVLGNEASSEFESFGVPDAQITTEVDGVPRSQHGAGGLLDYPHYTRPAEFHGLEVPAPLLNGDHSQIRLWRRRQQLAKTLANRPDLLAKAALSKEDREILESLRQDPL